jgi:two-component system response regulator VicR
MKILVADDEPDVRQALQFLFRKRGHEVILASRGDAALALVFAERPDVVFLDVNMPGKNGLDVCVELRAHPDCQQLPIYLLTGLDRSLYADHAGTSRATACLTKPLKSRELLNLLARIAESL